jgi:hypothetical protein
VSSAAEAAAIHAQVSSLAPAASDYWLGGNDAAQEGTWRWASGAAWGITHWRPRQPDGGHSENYSLR